jgi:cell division protein FtsB
VSARAYRIAPRRSAAGRRQGRVQWDRLGRIVLVVVLFLVFASYINPLVNFVDAWRDSRAEQTQLADLKRENARLRERATSLDGPAAAESAARKLGMVSEGERSYVIRGPKGK